METTGRVQSSGSSSSFVSYATMLLPTALAIKPTTRDALDAQPQILNFNLNIGIYIVTYTYTVLGGSLYNYAIIYPENPNLII